MSWSGGSFGERGACVLAPNANMMTLDGTNTWILREPGARRSIVVDPGPPDRVPPGCGRGAGRRGGRRTAHPPPSRPLRGREGVRGAGGLRRPRAGSAVPPRVRGPRGRRRGRGRRAGGARRLHPGPHRRLAVLRAPGRGGGADRRHRARPGHHRRGAPRRAARCLPRLARPAARARRGQRDRHRLARSRPGHRRCPRRPRLLHRPSGRAAPAGRGGARRAACRAASRRASRPTSCPAVSWRSSTPTSTPCSGVPPSSPCARSSPTSPGATEARQAARPASWNRAYGPRADQGRVTFSRCGRSCGWRPSGCCWSSSGGSASSGSVAT